MQNIKEQPYISDATPRDLAIVNIRHRLDDLERLVEALQRQVKRLQDGGR